MEHLSIGWPQLMYVVLTVLGLGYAIAAHGEEQPPYSMWRQIFAMGVTYPILYWGGFFG